MFRKISYILKQVAGLKTVVGAALFTGLMAFYIMPHGAKMISTLAGHEVQIFDLQFTYSPDQARQILSDYTEKARMFAATFSYLADTVYPVSYTLLFVLSMAWVFKNIQHPTSWQRHIHLFPIVTGIVDLCENSFVATMMYNYPDLSNGTVYIASFFTSAKWCLLGIQTLILVIGIGQLVEQHFSAK